MSFDKKKNLSWKLEFIHDIIEAKTGNIEVPNKSDSDLEDMLTVLCTY